MNKSNNNRLYTITEAARIIPMTNQALSYRVRNKLIESVNICGKKFVSLEAIKDYKKRRGKKKRVGKRM